MWEQVTRTVMPLHAAPRVLDDQAARTAGDDKQGANAAPADERKTSTNKRKPGTPGSVRSAQIALHALDRVDHRRLARGRTPIEARLDLHDMTQDTAYHSLSGFLVQARARGLRHVIIITGKGSGTGERGVLRRMVPHWLQTPPFREHVSGVSEAARNHGGEGALYVRLKRSERRGPASK